MVRLGSRKEAGVKVRDVRGRGVRLGTRKEAGVKVRDVRELVKVRDVREEWLK